MSVVTTPASEAAVDMRDLFRLTIDQYHDLIAAGILVDGDPVELVDGILVRKMTRKPPHATSVRRARRSIEPVLPSGFCYDAEQVVVVAGGEPEPDGAILRGSIDDYADRHPRAADVILLIEVAESTLLRDRTLKLHSYARAGIPTYWIVNLTDRQIEVHVDPDPAAVPEPTYRRRTVHPVGDVVTVPVANVAIPVADLLPPA